MGLAAAKQCVEQIICKNKVEPIKKDNMEPGAAAEANAMGLEMDENGIPLPVKRMAWEMMPKNSKLRSMLEICQRPPPEEISTQPQPPTTPSLSAAIPKPDETIAMTTTKINEAKNAFRAGVLGTGNEIQKRSEAAKSEASEMIEELDPQCLIQKTGLPNIAQQHPDAVSDVSTIVDK